MLIRLSYTPHLIAKTKQRNSSNIFDDGNECSHLINVLVVCCVFTCCHIKENESKHNLV